jgi:hypothetical protein
MQVNALRNLAPLCALIVFGGGVCLSQPAPKVESYFTKDIGLSAEQVKQIRDGKVITKELKSKNPDEIFVFGAVYVRGKPEDFVERSRDYGRLRTVPGYLAVGTFSDPPQISDLSGFAFEDEDIEALKDCKVGDCGVQIPASSIEHFRKSIDWAAQDARDKADQALQSRVLERLQGYQREGNAALGVYNDKENPVNVAERFRQLASFSRLLPKYLPDFYKYLIDYPRGRPQQVQDAFYWAKVKFGLKPTLRVLHVATMERSGDDPGYISAEKQLYASHYFRTALALTICIPGGANDPASGFYLIRGMGSEQGGLSGFKGSIIRKKAVGQTLTFLKKSIESAKQASEGGSVRR